MSSRILVYMSCRLGKHSSMPVLTGLTLLLSFPNAEAEGRNDQHSKISNAARRQVTGMYSTRYIDVVLPVYMIPLFLCFLTPNTCVVLLS
jgi:hypothetical protein